MKCLNIRIFVYLYEACISDNYEPNDVIPRTLTPSNSGSITATLCNNDVDSYVVTINSPGTMTVHFSIISQRNLSFIYQISDYNSGDFIASGTANTFVGISVPGTFLINCFNLNINGRADYIMSWSTSRLTSGELITSGLESNQAQSPAFILHASFLLFIVCLLL